jgi:uridine kinase
MTYEQWIQRIQDSESAVVALDGPSGAGKSTLARHWETQYGWTVFHTDDYFLPEAAKTEARMQEAGGNLDRERMLREIFSQLSEDVIAYQSFDCQAQRLVPRVPQPRTNVIVIEGVYAMHPAFLPYYDDTVFLDVSKETQEQRLKERNPRLWPRFQAEWIPLEDHYFKTFDIRKKADLVCASPLLDI